jgi:coronin-1B/1C/6
MSSDESNLAAESDVLQKYISINWNASGGGAFAILPLPTPFRPLPNYLPNKLPDVIPLARGHTAPVLDTDWNPFDNTVVASAGEDGKLLIWKVEDSQFDGWGAEKWVPIDFEPVARVDASPKKIGQVLFHPTASHVIATASGDHVVKLWDLNNTDDPRAVLTGHTDSIQSVAFNTSGTLLATTARDRKIRMFDPRSGSTPIRITDGHGGIKGARVTWMGDRDSIATTGFSKMSERQLCIWETGGLQNVKTVGIDQSAGIVMPFWSDNGILFLGESHFPRLSTKRD